MFDGESFALVFGPRRVIMERNNRTKLSWIQNGIMALVLSSMRYTACITMQGNGEIETAFSQSEIPEVVEI